MKALILVDLQNDFKPGGALAVSDGDHVVAVANRLMPHFDMVFATQDWHPADHRSFASQHDGKNVGDVIQLHGVEQVLWPDHCIQGTPGADLHADLQTEHIHHIVHKGTNPQYDSYSGFFDNTYWCSDRDLEQTDKTQQDTGLAELLRQNDVTEVAVMGLATDYCVKFTALDAVRLGLTATLISDGCRGVDLSPGDIERAVADMQAAGVQITDADHWACESSRKK